MQWGSSLPEPNQASGTLIIFPYSSVVATDSTFEAFANSLFLSAVAVSVLRCPKVAIGIISKLYARSFFESLSAAASVSKHFAMCASRISSMTFLGFYTMGPT